MEFAGAAYSIAPLVSTCQKIVDILRNVGQKFKRAPLMMTSIAAECTLIIDALEHFRNFEWSNLESQEDGRLEQMTRCAETIILGCTLGLSVIEEYASELQEYVEGSKLSPTEQMGIMARVRVLWKEDEMRELLLQLRGYQTALTNLLRAAHDDDDEDIIATVLQSLKSLLHRSRTSRSRKPLSVRSAMQQSVAYTNLARGPSQRLLTKASMTAPSGTKASYEAQGISAVTADLYDRAASATASRDPISNRSRKKRPVIIPLNKDDDNMAEPTRYVVHKGREHLRKSSPTVGESFHYVEGKEPENANGTAVILPESVEEEPEEEERDEDEDHNDEEDEPEDEEEEEGEDEDEDENEDEDEDDEEMEEHLEDPPVPPPGMPERLDPITEESSPKPKKQKSTSSVRSQIINLPETARLRKQASGELTPQQQRSMMTSPTPNVPPLKGTQGNQSTNKDLLALRKASELSHRHQLSDPSALATRFRGQQQPSQNGRTSAQDMRPHPTIIPLPYVHGGSSFATSPNISSAPMSPSLLSPTYPLPSQDEAWPLTPDMPTSPMGFPPHGRSMSHDTHQGQLRPLSPADDPTPRASRTNTPLFSNTPHRGRSRANTAATLNDEQAYQYVDDAASMAGSVAPSMMSAQWFRTPRERLGLGGRIRAEHVPWDQLDQGDTQEDHAPRPIHRHTLSNQSLRAGNGSVAMPQQRSRKVQLFTIYPPKSPPPTTLPEPPPRSPLFTENFLQDVGGLIEPGPASAVRMSVDTARPIVQANAQLQQQQAPSRTLSFRGLTKRRERSREADEKERDGKGGGAAAVAAAAAASGNKKKESRFPSFRELATEYKSLANKWHTSGEDDEDDRDDRRSRSSAAHHHPPNSHHPYPRPMTSHATFMGGGGTAASSNMSLAQARSQSTQPLGSNMISPTSTELPKSKLGREIDLPVRIAHSSNGSKSAIPVPASLSKLGKESTPSISGGKTKSKSGSKEKDPKKKVKGTSLFTEMRNEYRNISTNW